MWEEIMAFTGSILFAAFVALFVLSTISVFLLWALGWVVFKAASIMAGWVVAMSGGSEDEAYETDPYEPSWRNDRDL